MLGQRLEGLVEVPRSSSSEVVLDDQAAVVLDAAHELVELEADEPAVDAELDDVALDLLGDAPHHLGALQHGARRRAAVTRSSTSSGRERGRHVVEAVLVALERLQGLVGPVEQARDRLERVLLVADVDGDDRHVLGHRDHRHVDRAGHPLGGAVAGAGLRRRHVGVGHQVDVGPGDAAGVGGQDDGAVHLGQLGQPLGAEGGVEQEAARADRRAPRGRRRRR